MARIKKLAVLLTYLLTAWLFAVEFPAALEISTGNDFHNRHFAGGRIGVYSNTSDQYPEADPEFYLDFSANSIYAEFFYAYRLAPPLAVELSLGIFSRGEAQYLRIVDTVNNYYSEAVNNPVLLYPIWLSAKFYPLYKLEWPFRFFLQPGVGLVFGRHDIVDFITFNTYVISSETRAKFTYLLAAGVDMPISRHLALTAGFKYLPADFGKPLARVTDYTGWTLAVGIGYLFNK